jgi:hypothetical protein
MILVLKHFFNNHGWCDDQQGLDFSDNVAEIMLSFEFGVQVLNIYNNNLNDFISGILP